MSQDVINVVTLALKLLVVVFCFVAIPFNVQRPSLYRPVRSVIRLGPTLRTVRIYAHLCYGFAPTTRHRPDRGARPLHPRLPLARRSSIGSSYTNQGLLHLNHKTTQAYILDISTLRCQGLSTFELPHKWTQRMQLHLHVNLPRDAL